jgi:hypothetical protein
MAAVLGALPRLAGGGLDSPRRVPDGAEVSVIDCAILAVLAFLLVVNFALDPAFGTAWLSGAAGGIAFAQVARRRGWWRR